MAYKNRGYNGKNEHKLIEDFEKLVASLLEELSRELEECGACRRDYRIGDEDRPFISLLTMLPSRRVEGEDEYQLMRGAEPHGEK